MLYAPVHRAAAAWRAAAVPGASVRVDFIRIEMDLRVRIGASNPGGEARVFILDAKAAALIPEAFKNVLMSKERIDLFNETMNVLTGKASERARRTIATDERKPREAPIETQRKTGQ